MPKKAPKVEEQLQDTPIHPDLEFQDGPSEATPEQNDAEKRLAALEASLAERDARLAALQEQNLALMTTPATAPVPPQPPRQVSYEGLPDPSLDPQAHGQALAERLRAEQHETERYNNELAAAREQETERYNAVWNDFAITHADYADKREQVEWAASKVLQKSRAKGINDQRYVFGHPEKFMADVVKEFDSIFGKPGGDDEGNEGSPTPAPARKSTASRTVGMIGGMEGGGKPSKSDSNPQNDDMFRDIRQFQLKHGFYA